MCGIAGKIYLNEGIVKEKDLLEMGEKIIHRGPNDSGTYISPDKKVGLLNRRLSIIDLSSGGHQPMSYKNRLFLTTNGEIYNFQEERQKLIKSGYKFKSFSDTEVLLRLYDKYKINCLKYLRGMFAFAIYDREKQIIFLARDRVGKKPLKYFFNGNVFIFASELKSLLTQKEVKKIPDFLSINNYLTYGYVPAPNTGFKNILKLEPGNYLILDLQNKTISKKCYWQPDFNNKINFSENEWCENILDVLEDSTKLRMVSDVPIGAFLSGGTDSSSVIAMMAKNSKKPIKTFTIGFKEISHDESKYAQKISDIYHTDHNLIMAQPTDIEILPQIVKQYEEPYADSSAIITYMICKLAKQYVSVVLTGDGGDENFGGYDNRMKRLQRDVLYDKFMWLIRPIGNPLFSLLEKEINYPYFSRVSKFFQKSTLDIADRYVTYNCFFTNNDKALFYSNKFNQEVMNNDSYKIARKIFSNSKISDKRDQALFFDLVSWLPDSQLTKVDIASMAFSLEARSPYLDQKMIELACKIPFNLKVCDNGYKYILKKAIEKIVPKENLYRKKMGFTIPLDQWFTKDLNKYASGKLLAKNSFVSEIFNMDYIKTMLKTHSVSNDFGPKIWSLLTLELWFREYFG